MGEVISAVPVVQKLKETYPSKNIILTVTTRQGMEIARKNLAETVDRLLPMPLDFWLPIKRITQVINPSIFILVETDIWPGLTAYLKKRAIPLILINGRISPQTFKHYHQFRFFTKTMMDAFNLCLMQSDLDTNRLLQLGLSPKKIKTIGNIKFDRQWRPMDDHERQSWLNTLRLHPQDRIWVAGSTHDDEEDILLDTYNQLVSHFPNLRLIIAPRRIERAEEVYQSSKEKGLSTIYKTDLTKNDGQSYNILILNTIGELERFYGLAEISFVGGSLVPLGGHNLLEPAGFGCPVLFGPHIQNFVHMSQLLIDAGGGIMVKDAKDLYDIMEDILRFPEKSKQMGKKAKECLEVNKGALERIMAYIGEYIQDD